LSFLSYDKSICLRLSSTQRLMMGTLSVRYQSYSQKYYEGLRCCRRAATQHLGVLSQLVADASHSPGEHRRHESLSLMHTSVHSPGEHKRHESRKLVVRAHHPVHVGWCPYCHHSLLRSRLCTTTWYATHHVHYYIAHHVHYYTVYRHVCTCCQSVSAACAACAACAA
jgi:hypothetical protein